MSVRLSPSMSTYEEFLARACSLTDAVALFLDVIVVCLPFQEGKDRIEHRLDATAALCQLDEQRIPRIPLHLSHLCAIFYEDSTRMSALEWRISSIARIPWILDRGKFRSSLICSFHLALAAQAGFALGTAAGSKAFGTSKTSS